MRCWFHKWLPWSRTYDRENKWGYMQPYQYRTCAKCNKVEEREI